MSRTVVVTGVGLASSLGEGAAVHARALRDGTAPVVDADNFAPYPIHPLPELDYKTQIPKRGDLRQMEGWQRLGVYAAGLALDAAGLKDDAEAKAALQLLVAAGGGERDEAVDGAIATGMLGPEGGPAYLNEKLTTELRPTLFLAQLSNLLAGNIAIVHGVTGGSRTFMGEEQAGVDALRVAVARVAAGQCDVMLVGGAYSAARRDMLLFMEFAGALHHGGFAPVFSPDRGGAIMGSVGAFLVLEPAEAAAARGAKAMARIDGVAGGWAQRTPGEVGRSLRNALGALGAPQGGTLALSAATGVAPWTAEEREALEETAGSSAVATGDLFGHALEAAFPAAVALAACALDDGQADSALVTGVSHWRGEGAARLSRPD
jgi:3-oxoacyl-[acyl-carrier-protein] synthase II